ncbi:MAG: hypothetical protein GXX84_11880 [Acidobacteria bacterium]|nr:hypothetical protein [Acidobacteriota bacterium]
MVRKRVFIRKKDKKIIDAGRAESSRIPPDPEVAKEFSDASRLAGSGSGVLQEKLRQHTSSTPDLAAQDVDADWERDDVGDEMVGGDNMTPDQSVVQDIGDAVGIRNDDERPLRASVETKSPGTTGISGAGSIHRNQREKPEERGAPDDSE